MAERDPFARFSISKQPVPGKCSWCGMTNRWGKVWKYTVEHDGGRNDEVRGQFCNKDCRRSYHG